MKEAAQRDDDTDGADQHGSVPEEFLVGEEREGADDQSDFEDAFASVEAVGFGSQKIAFILLFFGFFADAVLIAAVALDFLLIFFAEQFGLFLVLNGKDAKLVHHHLHFV